MEPEATFNSVKEFIGMQHHTPAAAFRAAVTLWSRTEFQAGENQWQLPARTASDAVNYANVLIREAERADKTKQPLFNHSWGLLELWSQIYNACRNVHILCVRVCRRGDWVNIVLKNASSALGGSDDHGKTDGNQSRFLSHSSPLAPTPMGYFMWIYGAHEGWRFS